MNMTITSHGMRSFASGSTLTEPRFAAYELRLNLSGFTGSAQRGNLSGTLTINGETQDIQWYTFETSFNASAGQNIAYIDLDRTLGNGNLRVDSDTATIVLTVYDNENTNNLATVTLSNVSIRAARPAWTTPPDYQDYVNRAQIVTGTTMTLAASSRTGDPTWVRVGLVSEQVWSTNPVMLVGESAYSTQPSVGWGGNPDALTNGTYRLYVCVLDEYLNASDVAYVDTVVQKDLPAPDVRLIGSGGQSGYTGVRRDEQGHFVLDKTVTVVVSLAHPIACQWKVKPAPDSQAVAGATVDSWKDYDPTDPHVVVTVATNPATPALDQWGVDADVKLSLEFQDAAGNSKTLSNRLIRLNTCVYRAAHAPLQPPSSDYTPFLAEQRPKAGGGYNTVDVQRTSLSSQNQQPWGDICYPITHDYPRKANGQIDEAACILMNEESNDLYDAVKLNEDRTAIQYDEKGRTITTNWRSDKVYDNLVSADSDRLACWVIDHTNLGDFALEFEYFDVDGNIYGPPYNAAAPYKGDLLAVYDASAAGCLEQTINQKGELTWQLARSDLLVELFTFTGQGRDVVNLTTGLRMESNAQGGFTSPLIVNVPKVVLIFYSDAQVAGSGFKLRSAPATPVLWTNWETDDSRGEIYVHKQAALTAYARDGAADVSYNKTFSYRYYATPISINYETGTVSFSADPGGTVTASYSYYTSDEPSSRKYLASEDDWCEYLPASVYVAPAGVSVLTSEQKEAVYDINATHDTSDTGRIVNHLVWNKDAGYVELAEGWEPTTQRVIADYSHHSLPRLSADGRPDTDLQWYAAMIVPGSYAGLSDYTYADLKITNEGDAALQSGVFKFSLRGHDSDSDNELNPQDVPNADTVLDINRPWDLQQGTADETFDRMALAVSSSWTFAASCSRDEAQTIFNDWHDASGRPFILQPREFCYGRAVWFLEGNGGYPANKTSGSKRCSLELTGQFFSSVVQG